MARLLAALTSSTRYAGPAFEGRFSRELMWRVLLQVKDLHAGRVANATKAHGMRIGVLLVCGM